MRRHLRRIAGAWLPGPGVDRSGAAAVFLDIRPDIEGARMLARIGRAAFAGDDGLLSAVIRVLGEEGFRVIGAHEILHEALGPRGLLSVAVPDANAMADIARGIAVTRALGSVDVGQSCVVSAGVVVAVEAVEGTDAMLSRCGALLDALEMTKPIGVLVKSVKPGQDRRADLPTIGPETIRLVAAAQASPGSRMTLAERSWPSARPVSREPTTWAILVGLTILRPPKGELRPWAVTCTPCCALAICNAASTSTPRRSA